MKGIKVRVEDLETGRVDEKVVEDDWLLITHGRVELTHTNVFRNGTAILTVKRQK